MEPAGPWKDRPPSVLALAHVVALAGDFDEQSLTLQDRHGAVRDVMGHVMVLADLVHRGHPAGELALRDLVPEDVGQLLIRRHCGVWVNHTGKCRGTGADWQRTRRIAHDAELGV